jgi:hypothetical protein
MPTISRCGPHAGPAALALFALIAREALLFAPVSPGDARKHSYLREPEVLSCAYS